MKAIVRKPTEEEIIEMKECPTWSCEASVFDWYFDDDETCLILEGEATVKYEGGEVSFGKGDLVIFPKGMQSTWDVSKPIKKHYK